MAFFSGLDRSPRVVPVTGRAPSGPAVLDPTELDALRWQLVRECARNQNSPQCAQRRQDYLREFGRYTRATPLPPIPRFEYDRPNPGWTIFENAMCLGGLGLGQVGKSLAERLLASGLALDCGEAFLDIGRTFVPEARRVD